MPKSKVTFRGIGNRYTGYGLHLFHTAEQFRAFGYDVSVLDETTAPTGREVVILPAWHKARAHEWLFTMHETTRMSKEFCDNVKGARHLVVPSTWSACCISAQTGCAPYAVPLGYDPASFYPQEKPFGPVTLFGAAGNPSVSFASRKNLNAVIEAFQMAFPGEADVSLEIKVLPTCDLESPDNRIRVIKAVTLENAVGDWLRTLDLFVSLSHGEAYGLFQVQAMACATPVACPSFGGVADYLTEDNGFPVAYALKEADAEPYVDGMWAVPDVSALADVMRRVYRDRNVARAKGAKAVASVSHLTWENSARQLEAVLLQTRYFEQAKPVSATDPTDLLTHFYRNELQVKKAAISPEIAQTALSNTPRGLGDTLLLTHLPYVGACQGKPRFIHCNPTEHRHFSTLMHFNPYYVRKPDQMAVTMADVLQRETDMGNGHFIQRLQRAYGLEPDLLPKPYLGSEPVKVKNRVVLHFDAGKPHSNWQKIHLHPRARQLYPESRAYLQTFIDNHPELDFYQIGHFMQPLRRVTNVGCPLRESVDLVSKASLFIGIPSGPMHIAAAFRVRSIVILNFPPAKRIFLPTLVDIDQVESEWMYAQNVHLHQDTDGPLVPRLSEYTLESAYAGGIYPFWSDKYLGLINEAI